MVRGISGARRLPVANRAGQTDAGHGADVHGHRQAGLGGASGGYYMICVDRGHFHHLVPMHLPAGLHFFQALAQFVAAMAAVLRQDGVDFIDSLRGRLGPMVAGVARLAAGLLPTRLSPGCAPPGAGVSGQPIRRGRLGGVARVLLAGRQLPLQLGDLLFLVADLLVFLGDLLGALPGLFAELFILPPQPLDLSQQRA